MRRLIAGCVVVVALIGSAAAKDATPGPVARYLQALDVAPAVEHRVVVLHPVLALPTEGAPPPAVGGVATPDRLAFGKMDGKAASPRVDAVSFTKGPVALFAGDVLRTDTADFAVQRDVVVPGGKPAEVALVRVSKEVPPDPKAGETAMLGPVLPSGLLFEILAEKSGPEVRETCLKWAEDVRLPSSRLSPADLPFADTIKKRAADYRKAFADFDKRGTTGGREMVGVAVLLSGKLAAFETYADGRSFSAAWPRLLDGIASEAAVVEARTDLLEKDICDPADPDRFLSDLKKRLLGAYGARPAEKDLGEGARNIDMALDGWIARALVLPDDRVVHFVLVVDPARRGDSRRPETIDPEAARRKLRPTEEEKRVGERRGGETPEPPPPAEPPPTPPK